MEDKNKELQEKIMESIDATKIFDAIDESGVIKEISLDDLDSCTGGVADPSHVHTWTGVQYMSGMLKNLKCTECGERQYIVRDKVVDLRTFCSYLDVLKENFSNVFEEPI